MNSSNNQKVPYHLAVIPDGNRRWAKTKNISLAEGYAKGAANFFTIAEEAFASGVKYFTIWGASEDNLKKRSATEVKILTFLLKKEFKKFLESGKLERDKVCMKIVGNGLKIINDKEATRLAKEIEKRTEHFTAHRMTFLFGYDGKTEMLSAIQKIKEDNGKVTYNRVKEYLMTGDLPEVDFVIRTGGEPHWSAGFLMWLTCDSEFYFPETYWPGFHARDLKLAFSDFSNRRSLKGK